MYPNAALIPKAMQTPVAGLRGGEGLLLLLLLLSHSGVSDPL